MKRNFTILLLMLLCISLLTPVYAAQAIPSEVFGEEAINQAIDNYFQSRKDFLKGNRNDIVPVVDGILADELLHKQALIENEAVYLTYSLSGQNVAAYSGYAVVNVVEAITYRVSGTEANACVNHQITVYQTNQGNIVIGADAYKDDVPNFESCSYVNAPATYYDVSPNALQAGGSRNCIVEVARNEIGYVEGTKNYTKYGVWFGSQYAHSEWCAIFVCWCANQAKVSTTIIPKNNSVAVVDNLLSFFVTRNQYFVRGAGTPRAGDLYFEGVSINDLKHVGIVSSVGSTSFTIIEGNYPDRVQYRTISLTASNVIAFARPAYATISHSYVAVKNQSGVILYYQCSACGHQVTNLPGATRLQSIPFPV